MRVKRAVCLLVATSAAALGLAVPASAAPVNAAPAATVESSADPVSRIVAKNPAAFEAGAKVAERYLTVSAAGTMELRVPANVQKTIGPDVYQALQYTVRVSNQLVGQSSGVAADSVTTLSIPGAVAKFVTKYWSRILAIGKSSSKWAWYKAVQCSAGAMSALARAYGLNPAVIVTEIAVAITIAGAGCIANL